MQDDAIHFVRIRGHPHGPFSRTQLCELAGSGAISGETEIGSARIGPWLALGRSPLADVLTPPRREFERLNPPATPPLELRAIIAAANQPPPAAVSGSPPAPPSLRPNDVHALLRLNLAVERALGLHRLAPPRARSSRRLRDYAVALAIIGAAIVLVLLVECFVAVQVQVLAARMPDQFWPLLGQVLFHSPIFAWGLAAFAVYAIALGWVLFFIVDDY